MLLLLRSMTRDGKLPSGNMGGADRRVAVISFLNDIGRIGRRDYEPSDDDVIRARLRTLGVQEYRFYVEQGAYCSLYRPLEPYLTP